MQVEFIKQEKEPSSLKLIGTLAVVGLIAGSLLAAVYTFTLPIIKKNKEEALKKAIYKVLPSTTTIKSFVWKNNSLVPFDKNKDDESKVERIFAGYDSSGKLIGFAILGKQPGFQDIIECIIGYKVSDKTIIGFEVLESKETPGLGDKINYDKDFKMNFESLYTEPEVVLVKKGKKTKNNEIEAITGATISSRAVTKLINNILNEWKKKLDENYKTVENNE